MTFPERYDKQVTGVLGGIILPVFTACIVFLFAKGEHTLNSWLTNIGEANIITHIISLCVFPNLVIFLIFNYFDMLKASRGVLAVTIVWAIIVFGVKFLI